MIWFFSRSPKAIWHQAINQNGLWICCCVLLITKASNPIQTNRIHSKIFLNNFAQWILLQCNTISLKHFNYEMIVLFSNNRKYVNKKKVQISGNVDVQSIHMITVIEAMLIAVQIFYKYFCSIWTFTLQYWIISRFDTQFCLFCSTYACLQLANSWMLCAYNCFFFNVNGCVVTINL